MRLLIFAFCLMNTVCCFADSFVGHDYTPALKSLDNMMRTEQDAAKAQFSKTLGTWLGSHINELITQKGTPSGRSNAPNGGVIYEWLKSQPIFYAGHEEESPFGYSYNTPGETVTYWCKILFLTDTDGKVTDTAWEGNDCY